MRGDLSLIAALALVSCSPLCGDDRVVEAVSPDGVLVARAAVRNCGATTSYVGIVEVRQNRRWFNSPCVVFAQPWVMNPSVSWSGSRQLVIACNGCPSMRSRVKACKGLDVHLVHRPEGTGPSNGNARASEDDNEPAEVKKERVQ